MLDVLICLIVVFRFVVCFVFVVWIVLVVGWVGIDFGGCFAVDWRGLDYFVYCIVLVWFI